MVQIAYLHVHAKMTGRAIIELEHVSASQGLVETSMWKNLSK